jgi:multidrug efflux pump subunit AcrB
MRRLIEIATERRVTVVMLMVAIGLFGMVSLSRLNLNLLPDVSYPTVTIRTELTGAAPVEIENLITKPIEEAVGVIRNVRLVRSVSRSGQSDVTLEFLWGTDMDVAGVEVREKLDLLFLPLEASRPLLLRFISNRRGCGITAEVASAPRRRPHKDRPGGRGRHRCRQGQRRARRRNPDTGRSAETVATRNRDRTDRTANPR